MKTLQQELYNDEPEHFTNYDYIIQLIDNGQYSVLKDFLKEIDNVGLINLVRNRMKGEKYFADEILRRLRK
jgi:hypothetical protein